MRMPQQGREVAVAAGAVGPNRARLNITLRGKAKNNGFPDVHYGYALRRLIMLYDADS